jgi:hypothetical protein
MPSAGCPNQFVRVAMAKAGKKTNSIILQAGMSIGTNAAEFDDEFLLSCFVH